MRKSSARPRQFLNRRGASKTSRRLDAFSIGMSIATGLLVVLFVTGYFAVWLQVELPWMTEVGSAVLFWAFIGVLLVGWPLAVRHARKRQRIEDAEAIECARATLAERGVHVERPASPGKGRDRMLLDLPNIRDYRHMPWTNANVKSEDRP